MVTMADGRTFEVKVAGDPEDAMERMTAREGEFASGWVTEKRGTRLNLDHAKSLHAFEPRS